MNAFSSTHSITDTYTESRAQYVMGKIFDDFNHLIVRNFPNLTRETIRGWRDDLLFLMDKRALISFQIKFDLGNGSEEAWQYILRSDNSVHTDNASGGKDLYGYPNNTSVGIVVSHHENDQEVNDYMKARGWVSGGSYLSGVSEDLGAYSKGGYGTLNSIIRK
jgi:hypothetical protein